MASSSDTLSDSPLLTASFDTTYWNTKNLPILEGKYVILIPYHTSHSVDLYHSYLSDPCMFQYIPPPYNKKYRSSDDLDKHLFLQSINELIYTVLIKSTNQIIGRYCLFGLSIQNRTVEVGCWMGVNGRGNYYNLETIYLLLKYSFMYMKCYRVIWKTDSRNIASQKSAVKAGAVQECIIRSHFIMEDGYRRDSIFYSWLDYDWEDVKKMLEEKLLYNQSQKP